MLTLAITRTDSGDTVTVKAGASDHFLFTFSCLERRDRSLINAWPDEITLSVNGLSSGAISSTTWDAFNQSLLTWETVPRLRVKMQHSRDYNTVMDLFAQGKFLAGMHSLGMLDILYRQRFPCAGTGYSWIALPDILSIPASHQVDGQTVMLAWSQRAGLYIRKGDEEKQVYLRGILKIMRSSINRDVRKLEQSVDPKDFKDKSSLHRWVLLRNSITRRAAGGSWHWKEWEWERSEAEGEEEAKDGDGSRYDEGHEDRDGGDREDEIGRRSTSEFQDEISWLDSLLDDID